MGLFSGGNSSSSNTTNNYETNLTTSIDKDNAFQDSGGVLALGGDNNYANIEILDAGAINSAFDFANESQSFWGENFNSVLGTLENTSDSSYDFAENVVSDSFDYTTEALLKVGEANTNSVVAQRNLITAFADKNNSEKTFGLSSLLLPALFVGGGLFMVKILKG